MDANGAKPQEPKELPSSMQEMMEACCSGDLGPAEMCRRMMRSMGRRPDAQAQPAPEGGTRSDERGRSGEGETDRGCCGPGSCYAPERP